VSQGLVEHKEQELKALQTARNSSVESELRKELASVTRSRQRKAQLPQARRLTQQMESVTCALLSEIQRLGALHSPDPERTLQNPANPELPVDSELRPPDEVTSGWDVFDPDVAIENTFPAQEGAATPELSTHRVDQDIMDLT